jgi:hypothetical protein
MVDLSDVLDLEVPVERGLLVTSELTQQLDEEHLTISFVWFCADHLFVRLIPLSEKCHDC